MGPTPRTSCTRTCSRDVVGHDWIVPSGGLGLHTPLPFRVTWVQIGCRKCTILQLCAGLCRAKFCKSDRVNGFETTTNQKVARSSRAGRTFQPIADSWFTEEILKAFS